MERTGIYNEPVAGRVMVRKLIVDGDGQADLTVYGGSCKAVYVYDLENLRYWQQELDRDVLIRETHSGFREDETWR